MGSARSPKALPAQGALLLGLLFLLARPGCQAEVQVSVPLLKEVLLRQEVSIPCTHTVTGNNSYLLVEWFITDKNGQQRRVAYTDQGRQGVDRSTEYSDRVSMDADNSLVIKEVGVSDERTFSCQVTAGTAGIGTGSAQLKVYGPPEPPELTPNHGTLSVTEEGASEIAMCVSRNANPLPTISWYKDNVLLQTPTERNKERYVVWRTVKEASGLQSVFSTLYLRPTKADKDSNFHCQVNYSMPDGEMGSAQSESLQLKLHYYTENVHFALDSPKVIKEGDDVQLHCQSDGSPPPETAFYKLQAHGSSKDLGASNHGILHLRQVTRADSGTYRCQVLDFDSPSEVELEKEVTIIVNYLDPLHLTPSQKVTVKQGGNVQLNCSGTGSQIPMLSWRKGKEQLGVGGTLALDSLTYRMAGPYTCEATVPSVPGLRKEQTIHVTVEGAPAMEQLHSRSHYHSLGQIVTLTCFAMGHPEPEITWMGSGKPLDGASTMIAANRVTSELSVEVTAELAQSGVTCHAQNEFGQMEKSFQFEIVPPTTSAPQAPAVDGEEAQGGSTIAVIAVCICVLLLLLIVGFFYFMQRRGRLPCGGGEKRSLTPKEGNPDDTVVEMKTDKRNEQTGLLSPGGSGGGGTNEC
ncbi:basal cell adhesion molecule isoform X2 [Hemicordylus capensis]|uniref:basal cell adhesion molecule isoform X2 n=1 Tax=Hemicordylus capensis TaxID=884348 RepID=UPI0023036B51|nr:basal cell adhesion molecule isoform X2 [Hemicordylus capensis]